LGERRGAGGAHPSSFVMSLLFTALREFSKRHERLKKTVHESFRVPLPRWGRWIMGGVYFTLPILGGYHVMQWAISKSHQSIGVRGEFLPRERKELLDDSSSTRLRGSVVGDRRADGTTVGAGGWGGGVRLAVSDEETQRKNRSKLDKFLKKQQKQLFHREPSDATRSRSSSRVEEEK
jgi:hypothetical protein